VVWGVSRHAGTGLCVLRIETGIPVSTLRA
jgi:hypothetical protein